MSTTINEADRKIISRKRRFDRRKFVRSVWASRRLILTACSIGAILGWVIGLSVPGEYTATTLIVPESIRGGSSSSGMGAWTDLTGTMNSSVKDRDAIYPSLYPKIIGSTPFLIRLFDVKVRPQKDSAAMPLARYLKERQKRPWWSTVTSAPYRLVRWTASLFSLSGRMPEMEKEKADAKTGTQTETGTKPKTGTETKTRTIPYRLTREEAGMAGAISSRIKVGVDKEKRTITLFVTMQDPLVAATVVDTVSVRLKEYITEYRTGKARRTLKYYEKISEEAQAEYYAAQERYTRCADANRDLAMQASRAELSRLRNEMSLAFSTYNQLELRVQAARARVRKATPVYAVIQPATVPLTPSKPRKMLILAVCVLLAGAGSVAWVLFGKEFWKKTGDS